jgi:surface protein
MSGMFHYAEIFNGDISNWNVAKVADMTWMLDGSAQSNSNYDALLINWSALPVRSGVTFETSAHFSPGAAAAARANLIAKGWTIVDAGAAP